VLGLSPVSMKLWNYSPTLPPLTSSSSSSSVTFC
jgi:hypothetical protein